MTESSRPVRTQYEDFMRHVYKHGTPKTDRTGTGTRSVFGYQMRFDLAEGFPLVTTKKVHLKSIIYELLWFLQGSGNNSWLKERGVWSPRVLRYFIGRGLPGTDGLPLGRQRREEPGGCDG